MLRDKAGTLLGARPPAAFFAPVLVPGEAIVSDSKVPIRPDMRTAAAVLARACVGRAARLLPGRG